MPDALASLDADRFKLLEEFLRLGDLRRPDSGGREESMLDKSRNLCSLIPNPWSLLSAPSQFPLPPAAS